MKERLLKFSNTLAGGSFVYVSAKVVEAGVVFALLPILTTNLSKLSYGILSVYLVIAKFFIPIINFGTNIKISVDYFRKGVEELQQYIVSLFLIPFINFLLLLFFILIFQKIITSFLEIDIEYLLTIPIFVLLQYFPTIFLAITQTEKKTFTHSLFSISNITLNFLLAVLFIIVYALGWYGQIVGYSIGFMTFSLFSISYLYKKGFFNLTFNLSELIKGYKYGGPLLFYSFSGIIMSLGDRLVLKSLMGYEQVGLYTVGYQISTAISIIAIGLTKALGPNTFAKLKNRSKRSIKEIKRNIYFLMLGLFFISIIFILSKELIFKIFIDSSYFEAKLYVPVLVLGLVFQGFYMFKSNILFYYQKNNYLGFLAIACAFLNLLLNFLSIPEYGIMGACLSTGLTYFVLWIITWYLSWKELENSDN